MLALFNYFGYLVISSCQIGLSMKRFFLLVALASASLIDTAQAADVGVSVSIGQPGFYGQIDIGGYPQPRLIYAQPRIIERVYVDRPPIYLRVPPGHAKHWDRHCRKYNACGERVYFVRDDWYNREYAPRYQENHHEYHEDHRDEHRDERGGGYGEGRQDDHRGKGNGNGHGNKH
jgi:hypothetical protein